MIIKYSKKSLNSPSFFVWYLFICIIFSSIFVYVYKYNKEVVKEIKLEADVSYSNDDYYYGIDPVCIEDGYVVITGWVVPKYNNLEYINRKILLFDNDNKILEIRSVAYDRNLTWFLNKGFDYDKGGLLSQFKSSDLEEGKRYNIKFLVIEENGEAFLIDLETSFCI